ncbi:MAG: hypothetical protein HC837_06250 [Chloroflexaceae bacterium]|nr:hypothetical protein [Chloroflexaceae bacterium]
MTTESVTSRKIRNYHIYQRSLYVHPAYYPIDQTLPSERYQPVASWLGRLILPTHQERRRVNGVLFEVYHAPEKQHHLVGQVVYLRWSDNPEVQVRVWSVTRNVFFDAKTNQSIELGRIHPERLNNWSLVGPLESLAGAHPYDDVIVRLPDPVEVQTDSADPDQAVLTIEHHPVQVTGRYYALVQFIGPEQAGSDRYRVVHFNPATRQFDGAEETVLLPQVEATEDDVRPSTREGIEDSIHNTHGWYIYGTQNQERFFVIQALMPRDLVSLKPERVILDAHEANRYIKKGAWDDVVAGRGTAGSVLLSPQSGSDSDALAEWREGDRALLLHIYGGITGKKTEPIARTGIYFGHFAYGCATVVYDPLAQELRFDITYYQVYTHNFDGIISGIMDWSRYMGDRQWGWLGFRPVVDVLIKLDALTDDYDFDGVKRSALAELARMLETMTSRYRIGDGTGGTYVAASNNCAQDSNQALYATIKTISTAIDINPYLKSWLARETTEAARFHRLISLGQDLKRTMLPFGTARADWNYRAETLGVTLEETPVRNLLTGLVSWRTLMPRIANNKLISVFLKHGASAWVLRTSQVGGDNPDIEPLPPLVF